MSKQKKDVTYQIEIKGLVQGVGFRPFIYRLAKEESLNGTVENRNDGVVIRVNCNDHEIESFVKKIKEKAPPASEIYSINYKKIPYINYVDFTISESKKVSNEITRISPDIAVCEECLKDMKIQENRINYPFINCTNCGPRFTIIKEIPYDRINTTMNVFKMCEKCYEEYTNILDRRFHAQPIACKNCGPEYTLHYGNQTYNDFTEILEKVKILLNNGKIIAVKGYGGFFLACDAFNEDVVSRLRNLKKREGKPFAVMFSSIDSIKKYTFLNKIEEQSLVSFRRPVVILKQKNNLAPSVNVGLNTIGAILPYMPFHYLLFENFSIEAIVFTSGNFSEEPIVTEDNVALKQLAAIADAILTYNREIYNRVDDSVVRIINNTERIIRRSRGFVPNPIILNKDVEGILATGAELNNCFCIGKGNHAILSQHIGDLKNYETYQFYTETINKFKKLFNFEPSLIVSDLHPDYLSTRYAEESGIPHVKVQHHHAHIASCMAENNIEENVIGIAFDGTGYGTDGNIWGSEFFVCNLENFNRLYHFEYIPIPGGDKAIDEPWRIAVSYLYNYFGKDFLNLNLDFLGNIDCKYIELIISMLDKKFNCPLSCGAGRLFDAVAALINICTLAKFHSEPPMRLESLIDDSIVNYYHYEIFENYISFQKTFEEIINDLKNKTSVSDISTKFHNTIINLIVEVVKKIKHTYNLNKVVISGGTFQNKYLLENVEKLLTKENFEVYSHKKVPANDGGIALGQLIIGSVKRKLYL